MAKVCVGPKGGKYMMKGGRKVYLKSRKSKRVYKKRSGGRGRVIRGRGSYWSDFKDWSKKSFKPFETAGSTAGKALLGPAGGYIGGKLGSWLGSITGLGSYKVKSNTLLGLKTGGTRAGSAPIVENVRGKTIITHVEYLRDINSTEDFNNISYEVNPGLKTTFPWLSDIAACYQEWKPLGVVFYFESHSSNALNSTNTALGSIIMSSNYEADAPEFKNQQEALNTEFTTSTKPSESVMHPLECSPAENPQRIFYIRNGPLPATASSSLWYDLCKTQIMTLGSQAVANVGKLYISYQIEFLKPVLNGSASGKTYQNAIYALSGCTGGTPITDGESLPVKEFDNIGLVLGPTSVTFPQGNPGAIYQVQLNFYGGATACSFGVPVAVGADISLNTLYSNRTATYVPQSTVVAGNFLTNVCVSMGPLGIGGTLSYAAGLVLPLSNPVGELIVTRIHPELPPSADFSQKEEKMDPYEQQLRDFLSDRKNRHLSDEAKIMLFKELHVRKIVVDEPQTPQYKSEPQDLDSTTADLKLITTKIHKLALKGKDKNS